MLKGSSGIEQFCGSKLITFAVFKLPLIAGKKLLRFEFKNSSTSFEDLKGENPQLSLNLAVINSLFSLILNKKFFVSF